MKTWKSAEVVELDIAMTAYGKNDNAKEANAGKKPNNGAGVPQTPNDDFNKDPDVAVDRLS